NGHIRLRFIPLIQIDGILYADKKFTQECRHESCRQLQNYAPVSTSDRTQGIYFSVDQFNLFIRPQKSHITHLMILYLTDQSLRDDRCRHTNHLISALSRYGFTVKQPNGFIEHSWSE